MCLEIAVHSEVQGQRTQRDRTVVFVGTNNDGTFLSCATPKTRCQGVRSKVRNTAPIHTQRRSGSARCV